MQIIAILSYIRSYLWKHSCKLILIAMLGYNFHSCSLDAERSQEQLRLEHCKGKVCPGDVLPKYDYNKDALLKVNNKWFLGPKEYYAGFDNSFGFRWFEGKSYAGFELIPGNATPGGAVLYLNSDRDWSGKIPPPPYQELLEAEADGRLISRATIKPGLEMWKIKNDYGYLQRLYLAVEHLKEDPYGAVLFCQDESEPKASCGQVFTFKGIRVELYYFSAQNANDWLEIRAEIKRVLTLLNEVK